MNRIYKVIWSKVKHQYIVVSELAHSCTKSTSSRAGRSAAAVLAALILTTGVCAVPAQAADPTLEELYYEQLNSTVHNDETSSPVVKLVEAPTAVPTAAKDGEQAVDNDTQTGEDGGMTGAADQYTVVNEDGFYASNTKGTHNTLSKDGLWVGGTNDDTGFHVDNDGNVSTTGKMEVDDHATFNHGLEVTEGVTNLQGTNVNGNLGVTGSASVGGKLNVTDHATFNHGMTVTEGKTTLQDTEVNGTLDVAKDATVEGKLEVDDKATFNHGLEVTEGTTTLQNTNVNGILNVSKDAHINGTITANKGIIGGVTLNETRISAAGDKFRVEDDGTVKAADGNFRVTETGGVQANGSSTIGGVTLNETRISAAGDKFRVEDDGTVKAADGNFRVTETGGVQANGLSTIGGVTLNETRISAAGDKFRVEDTGDVKAVSYTAGSIKINENDSGTITGLSNKTWTGNKEDVVSGRAATEDQLMTVQNDVQHITHTENTDGTDYTTVEGANFYNDGSMDAANGAFRVNKDGGVNINDGAVRMLSGGTLDADYGNFIVNAKKHELSFGKNDDGTYNMTVDSDGNAVFAGNVEAADADFAAGSQELVTAGQLYAAGIVPGNAQGVNSIAIGINSQAVSTQDVAIGYSAAATGGASMALGLQSSANGSQSVAIGTKSVATELNSVALGANSTADRANTVSVGSVGEERQITNVAAGTAVTDAVNKGQLDDAVDGVVKWDSDGDGRYETGHLTSVTEFEANNQVGESITLNEKDGLILRSSGAQGNGTISMNDGTLSLRNGNAENTTFVDVTTNGTTFSQLTDNSKTTISGGNIVTDSVTGLDNTEWNGTTNNESRAATEGQLADLNEVVEDNAKGVVKWDNLDEEAGQIKGVTFAGYGNLEVSDLKFDTLSNKEDTFSVDADGSVSALNGQFVVNEDGMTVTGEDGGSFAINAAGEIAAATAADAASGYVYSFNMNNTEGITLGAEEATMTINDRGATFRGDTTDATTNINADEITTGTVLANSNMYIGTVDDGNAVVTQDQLTDTVGNATDGMVTWDQDPVDHTYQEGSLSSVTNLNVTGNATLQNSNNIFDSEYIALSDNPESRQLQLGSYVTGANDDITLGQITLENGTINMSAGSLSEPSNITEIYVNSDGLTVSTLGNDELGGTDKTTIDGGRITTGTINAANGNFVVDSDGSVKSINGEFSNLLHADVGRFDTLQVGARTGDNFAFYVANDGSVNAANDKFRVHSDGGVRTPWVTGLSNTTWTPDTVEYEGSANAATEGQLAVVDAKVKVNSDDLAAYKAAGVVPGTAVPEEAEGAMALGTGAEVRGDSDKAMAIGNGAGAASENAVAVGASAQAIGSNSLALGPNARTELEAHNGVAIGSWAKATEDNAIAIGQSAGAKAENAVAVGMKAKANSDDSIAIGTSSNVAEGGIKGIALGAGATIKDNGGEAFENGIAVGTNATVSRNNAIAIGMSSNSDGQNSVALGSWASATGYNSVALGFGSKATANNVISVGDVGYERKIVNVAKGEDNYDAVNVAQLNSTVANATKDVVSWDPNVEDTIQGVTLKSGKITAADGKFHVWSSGGIAIGEKDQADGYWFAVDGSNGDVRTRGNITANGTITTISDSGDATIEGNRVTLTKKNPNGDQDKLTVIDPSRIVVGQVTGDLNSGIHIVNNSSNDRTITGLTNTSWGTDPVVANRAATEGQLAAATKDIADIQTQVTDNTNGIAKLNAKFTEAGINKNSLEKAVAVANQLDGANLSALNTLSQIAPMSLNVPTMMNALPPENAQEATGNLRDPNEWGNNTTDGTTTTIDTDLKVTGDASFDKDVSIGGKLEVAGGASIDGGNLEMNNNKITGVADGTDAHDAVNFGQLDKVQQQVTANTENIGRLGSAVNKLDNRIDEVGAGAAALAALHPLDFDPDNKWDFSAGYGNYRGESAVAFGAFYRPNEDTMFSVGGTVGNDDNMVNAGVSIKIGSGSSGVTTSRVAMAKEIKAMRDVVAKQDAQIQKLTAMVNALVGVETTPDSTTMFPDVPENHWAYEAVAAMARSGLVKGYPDGEFKGDRTMTRYEFAQIIQNAIQAGAEVDSRLVEEFKPELEYFHIATVAKDKDGNPTIERVRAN